MDKYKKLKTGHVEITTEVTRTETRTVKPEILNRDITSAEESVARRESELESAQANLTELKALKIKVDKAK